MKGTPVALHEMSTGGTMAIRLSKKVVPATFVVALSSTLFTYQNCAKMKFSGAELQAIKEEPFSFNPNDFVAGVDAVDGTVPTENLRVGTVQEAAQSFVKDCSLKETYELEKQEALDAVKADPSGKTMAIAYAVSYGHKEDELADFAHRRAILSKNNVGESYIPVGPKKSSTLNGGHFYYTVNHDKAKEDYIKGDKCFFNTVTITNETAQNGSERYSFIKNAANSHNVHYMYYGWCDPNAGGNCASDGNYGKDKYANRLFEKFNPNNPQIVKLYVADIRERHLALGSNSNPVININESAARGAETTVDIKELLDMDVIYQNLGQAIRNLSSDRTGDGGKVFTEMVGVPQLLHNLLLAGESGTVISSQYTPIALDLGDKKVVTASVNWGSFFNMAALQNLGATGDEALNVPHKTAWLSGGLVDVNSKINDGKKFKLDARRVVSDGFLVMPDADGKVRSSRNMFGDHTIVNGKTYDNGFLALQALANKNCDSEDVKERYLGPWDEDLYKNKVKVWVDADKNGVVGDKEVQSLAEAGVIAISSCNIVHSESEDSFGNGTHLRSAFLFESDKDSKLDEEEIIYRITTGEKGVGGQAEFRLAIDLIFKTRPDVLLKNYSKGLK